jgi:hypothetical protein
MRDESILTIAKECTITQNTTEKETKTLPSEQCIQTQHSTAKEYTKAQKCNEKECTKTQQTTTKQITIESKKTEKVKNNIKIQSIQTEKIIMVKKTYHQIIDLCDLEQDDNAKELEKQRSKSNIVKKEIEDNILINKKKGKDYKIKNYSSQKLFPNKCIVIDDEEEETDETIKTKTYNSKKQFLYEKDPKDNEEKLNNLLLKYNIDKKRPNTDQKLINVHDTVKNKEVSQTKNIIRIQQFKPVKEIKPVQELKAVQEINFTKEAKKKNENIEDRTYRIPPSLQELLNINSSSCNVKTLRMHWKLFNSNKSLAVLDKESNPDRIIFYTQNKKMKRLRNTLEIQDTNMSSEQLFQKLLEFLAVHPLNKQPGVVVKKDNKILNMRNKIEHKVIKKEYNDFEDINALPKYFKT